MGKTETDGNNLMLDIHKELLQEIRERESDIWKFWTIFISALGSWTVAAWKYLGNLGKCNGSSEYLLIFLGGSIFVLILLSWGLGLVFHYGYQFRMFQKVLYDIEKEQGLTEKIIPLKWDPCKKDKKLDLPGIYKVHLYAFSFATTLVMSILLLVLLNQIHWYYIFLGTVILGFILGFILDYYCSRKKLKKICSNEKILKGR